MKERIIKVAERYAQKRKLPLGLVLAIIEKESKFKPQAYNKNKDGTEDYGVMQVNYQHNLHLMEKYGIKDPSRLFDIETNIEIGTKILKDFIEMYKKVFGERIGTILAVKAYNGIKPQKNWNYVEDVLEKAKLGYTKEDIETAKRVWKKLALQGFSLQKYTRVYGVYEEKVDKKEMKKLEKLIELAQELPHGAIYEVSKGFWISREGIVVKDEKARAYRVKFDEINQLRGEAVVVLMKKLNQMDEEKFYLMEKSILAYKEKDDDLLLIKVEEGSPNRAVVIKPMPEIKEREVPPKKVSKEFVERFIEKLNKETGEKVQVEVSKGNGEVSYLPKENKIKVGLTENMSPALLVAMLAQAYSVALGVGTAYAQHIVDSFYGKGYYQEGLSMVAVQEPVFDTSLVTTASYLPVGSRTLFHPR